MSVTQVTTPGIADINVTNAKLADDSVTAAKLASDSVITAKILDGNVTNAKLAANAVTPEKVANNTYAISISGNAATSSVATQFSTTASSIPSYAIRAYAYWGSSGYGANIAYFAGANVSSIGAFYYPGYGTPAYRVYFTSSMPSWYAVSGICGDINYSPKIVELGRATSYIDIGCGPYSGGYIFPPVVSIMIISS